MSAVATIRLGGDDVPTPALAKRLGSALVLIPVVVWLTLAGPAPLFHGVIVVFAAAAAQELTRLFERAGRATHGWLTPALAGAVAASFVVPRLVPAVLTGAILVALAASVWRRREPATEPTTTTLLAVSWVGWTLGHVVLLRDLPQGGPLVLMLLAVTWAGDTAAYAVGSAIGRTKLAPVVSPNKTVEGAIAQAVAATLAAGLLRGWLVPDWSWAAALAIGLALGVVAQVGDLAESVIKRTLGTKDTGGLIPGHGGVLDRLDSMLFNAPTLYYLVIFVVAPGAPS